jgi:hypothetical protein
MNLVRDMDTALTVIGDNLDSIVLPDADTAGYRRWLKITFSGVGTFSYEYVVPRSMPTAPSNRSSIITAALVDGVRQVR